MTHNTNSTLSEITIHYKTKIKHSEKPVITSSAEAAKLLRSIWSTNMEIKEESYILLLNSANRVKGWYKLSEGGVKGTVVDPKLIFSIALKCLACGVILAHNHPSGNLKPSNADIALTKKLQEGGKFLEITLLDHLILTSKLFYSFADEGML